MNSQPTPIVADAGPMIREVHRSLRPTSQATSPNHLTSTLMSLSRGTARLFIPHVVVNHIAVHLSEPAADHDSARRAHERWQRYYLSRATIIDEVPDHWAASEARIINLTGRDHSDLPAARLAIATEAIFLADDPDLLEADRLGTTNWLPVVHGTAAQAEVEAFAGLASVGVAATGTAATAALRALARAPVAVQATLAVGAAALVGIARHSPGLRRLGQDVYTGIVRTITGVAPTIIDVHERALAGQDLRAQVATAPALNPCLGEQIAWILARHSSEQRPVLARDIVDRMEGTGALASAGAIRAEMRAFPDTFCEVRPGRFMLGRPSGMDAAPIEADELADFMRRAHPQASGP